jgi:hypothetical protein
LGPDRRRDERLVFAWERPGAGGVPRADVPGEYVLGLPDVEPFIMAP